MILYLSSTAERHWEELIRVWQSFELMGAISCKKNTSTEVEENAHIRHGTLPLIFLLCMHYISILPEPIFYAYAPAHVALSFKNIWNN